MVFRDSSLLRYTAALLAIASSLFFMLIYIGPAINSLVNPNYSSYYNVPMYVPIYSLLIIIYFFAFLEGLLMLFRSRHIGLGILLILEAIAVFLSSSPSNNFILAVISSLTLFISGSLILIYKPITTKLTTFPKLARRCISLGAFLILSAFLIYIGSKLSILLILYSSQSQSMSLNLSNYLLPIIAYLLMALAIFLITLYTSFKLRTKDAKQVSKYSRFALYMVPLVVVSVILMSLLFQIYGLLFVTSNYAVLGSVLPSFNSNGNNVSLPSLMAILITIISFAYVLLLCVGIISLLLGSLSGLAFSKRLGFIEYLLANRRTVLYCVVALMVVYTAFSLYSSHQINTDNNLALSSLNSKIQLYGSNLRYLLANKSAYNAALAGANTVSSNPTYSKAEGMYETLLMVSSPQSNISSVFTFGNAALRPYEQQPSTLGESSLEVHLAEPYTSTNQELSGHDWYNYNPLVRTIELDALFTFGLAYSNVGNNVGNTNVILQDQKSLIPSKVSPLQSMYELQNYGVDGLLTAQSLGSTIIFGTLIGQNINATKLPVNALGVGMSVLPGAGTGASTSVENGSFYDLISGSPSVAWLEFAYMIDGAGGHGLSVINDNTLSSKFFYTLALNQYDYYYSSQMFYNQTISPNIDFIGYLNNTLVINLGNLNLTNPQISLSIDGNQTAFKRYYNYLIVNDKHLATGHHEVMANVNGLSFSQNLYISPVILSNPSYSHSGILSFSIPNPYPSSLNITNISVSGGVIPQPSITPINTSYLFYNWSSVYTGNATLANVTYVKFNFYQKVFNNYRNINYTISNTTSYNIPISKGYVIDRNDSLYMNFVVPHSYVRAIKYYTVTFNTNYGTEHVILQVNAI